MARKDRGENRGVDTGAGSLRKFADIVGGGCLEAEGSPQSAPGQQAGGPVNAVCADVSGEARIGGDQQDEAFADRDIGEMCCDLAPPGVAEVAVDDRPAGR